MRSPKINESCEMWVHFWSLFLDWFSMDKGERDFKSRWLQHKKVPLFSHFAFAFCQRDTQTYTQRDAHTYTLWLIISIEEIVRECVRVRGEPSSSSALPIQLNGGFSGPKLGRIDSVIRVLWGKRRRRGTFPKLMTQKRFHWKKRQGTRNRAPQWLLTRLEYYYAAHIHSLSFGSVSQSSWMTHPSTHTPKSSLPVLKRNEEHFLLCLEVWQCVCFSLVDSVCFEEETEEGWRNTWTERGEADGPS